MGWLGKMAKFGLTPWGANVSATLAGTTNPILVLERDKNMDILRATGTEVPTSTTSGYAKGCLFIDRNVTTGTTGLYENIGTNTSCNFNAIGSITAGEITLAQGSVLIGNASGVATALDGKGDAKILVGNGTTMTSVALSQDLTITNAGVVTIAKINNLATAAEVNQVCDGNTATAAEISQAADLSAQVMVPGSGITAGVGTVFKTSVVRHGDIIKTTIIIDLTGLASSTTADDIIGTAGVSHIGQITALNGALFFGQITCLETPAGGDLDIDFWSATEATGAFDALVTDLTEVIMRANGGNWAAAAATQIAFTNLPAANKYMYMAVGSAGGSAGTYTAGQFLIELFGTA